MRVTIANRTRSGVACIVGLWLFVSAHAGDSRGYRGVNTSGFFEAKGLMKKWQGCHGPKLLWKFHAGYGYAGPLVIDHVAVGDDEPLSDQLSQARSYLTSLI